MTRIYMHYYKDEPLYHYCLKRGYNYGRIVQFINYDRMSVEDAVSHYLKCKGTKDLNNVKYIIDGVPVRRILTREQYQHFVREVYKRPTKDWKKIYKDVSNG